MGGLVSIILIPISTSFSDIPGTTPGNLRPHIVVAYRDSHPECDAGGKNCATAHRGQESGIRPCSRPRVRLSRINLRWPVGNLRSDNSEMMIRELAPLLALNEADAVIFILL